MKLDARKVRAALGAGVIIRDTAGQQYITGRSYDWNGVSWMAYPCDDDDHVILHLPAVQVYPVRDKYGTLIGYSFNA